MVAGRGKGRGRDGGCRRWGLPGGGPVQQGRGVRSMSRWSPALGRKPHFSKRKSGKKLAHHIQGPLEGPVPIGRLLLKVRDKVLCRGGLGRG